MSWEVLLHRGAAAVTWKPMPGLAVRWAPASSTVRRWGYIKALGDDGAAARGDSLAHLVPGAVEVHRTIGGELQERIGHEIPAFLRHGEARGRAAPGERKGHEEAAPSKGAVAKEAAAAERAHADTSSAMASVKRASCARLAAAV